MELLGRRGELRIQQLYPRERGIELERMRKKLRERERQRESLEGERENVIRGRGRVGHDLVLAVAWLMPGEKKKKEKEEEKKERKEKQRKKKREGGDGRPWLAAPWPAALRPAIPWPKEKRRVFGWCKYSWDSGNGFCLKRHFGERLIARMEVFTRGGRRKDRKCGDRVT